MTYKDLKKLRRMDLLELLIEQKKENESLREEILKMKQTVETARPSVESASYKAEDYGTMAEAALMLNKVFENIDAAASQYLDNIKRCSMEQQDAFDLITADARKEADEIISKAQEEAKQIRAAAEERLLAASQYLESVKRCSVEQQGAFSLLTADAQKEADEIIRKAQAEAKEIRATAEGRLLVASQTAQKTEAEAVEKANMIINAAAKKAREVLLAAGRTDVKN